MALGDFFPKIEFSDIEDVDQTAMAYIRKHYHPHYLLVLALAGLWEILVLVFLRETFSTGGVYFLLIPLLVLAFLYRLAGDEVRKEFMRRFARQSGYHYEKQGSEIGRPGFAFDIGHSRKLENWITGEFQGFSVELFNYCYTIGHGKVVRYHFYTVFELDFPQILPHLFLKAKRMNFGQPVRFTFQNEQEIPLEGDFYKKFTLLAPVGWQLEALQIFTPDFMERLQSYGISFSLEFAQNHIYIYCNYFVTKKETMLKMYDLAQHLITHLGPILEKLEKSACATGQYFKNRL